MSGYPYNPLAGPKTTWNGYDIALQVEKDNGTGLPDVLLITTPTNTDNWRIFSSVWNAAGQVTDHMWQDSVAALGGFSAWVDWLMAKLNQDLARLVAEIKPNVVAEPKTIDELGAWLVVHVQFNGTSTGITAARK